MSEQIITKTCRTCKQTKPITDFAKRLNSCDGYRNECKNCKYQQERHWLRFQTTTRNPDEIRKQRNYQKCYQKQYSQTHKGIVVRQKALDRYTINHPERRDAKAAVRQAVKIGELAPVGSLQCSCGEPANQYHHHKGYAREHWLDIIPLCKKCHTLTRRK